MGSPAATGITILIWPHLENIMKKTLIALTLAAIIPAAAYAASDGRGHHTRGPHIERLAERLELSEEQQAKVRTLFEEQREQHQAMREQMRSKMAEVLTQEQIAKMEAMREMHKEKRMNKRAHRKGRHCAEDQGAKSS